jgi:hypothetical protein
LAYEDDDIKCTALRRAFSSPKRKQFQRKAGKATQCTTITRFQTRFALRVCLKTLQSRLMFSDGL